MLLQRLKEIYELEGSKGIAARISSRLQSIFHLFNSQRWLAEHTPTDSELMAMERYRFTYEPLISIVMPVYNTPRIFLQAAIDSVLAQRYSAWQLCIADDCSTAPHVREILDEAASKDDRVTVVYRHENGHIAHSSNSALKAAKGEFVALLDHDDLLAPHALFEVVKTLNERPDADLLYSNEDKLDAKGRRTYPTFKPQWSPDYFLSFMYIGHLSVYRTALVRSLGGFRPGFEGSQDYDLALRVTERTDKIVHIPRILYHWRMHEDSVAGNIHAKPYAFTAGKKALEEALQRRSSSEMAISDTNALGIYRCVASVPETTFDILQLEDCNSNRDFLQKLQNVHKDFCVVIAPEISPENAESCEALVAELRRPGVRAAVPAVLRGGRFIVGGVSLESGVLSNNFYGARDRTFGYGARLVSVYNISQLSSLCFAIRTSTIRDCLEALTPCDHYQAALLVLAHFLKSSGQRIVWTPFARFTTKTPVLQRIHISSFTSDATILNDTYELGSYSDPYYPHGLDRNALNFHMHV